ncbi:MAG: Beta-propeller domain protein [Bacteroidetes bacterium]|jgi:uncharacterized membrane protein YgcG|nr:Beta-propeller domain protein [Bacteroidota bacterium]
MEIKRLFPAFFFFVFLFNSLKAQDFYLPEPSGQVVTDYENLLTEEEKGKLAGLCKTSYNSSSNQLMIVCIPTKFMGSLMIEEYANKLFKKWQPGQKGLNNGVLMIISGSKLDSVNRKLRFEVGYGLEGALPDLLCKKIQKELMVPKLKEHQYYEAISLGTKAILDAISGENAGKTPVFRFKVQNTPVLKDQAGLLSPAEFGVLSEKLKDIVKDENEAAVISVNQAGYTYGYNYVSLSVKWTGYPVLTLDFPNPYLIEQSDSGGIKVSRPDKLQGVSLTAACLLGHSDEEQKEMSAHLKSLLDSGQYTEAVQTAITYYTDAKAARTRVFYGWMIGQMCVGLLAAVVYYMARARLKKRGAKLYYKKQKGHRMLTVFSILAGIVVWPGVVTFEIPQMAIWNIALDGLPTVTMWIWGSLLFVFHVLGVVYLVKLGSLKQQSKSRSSGGYTSPNTYSNSNDYNSSSSSSSSDSSYSSSSSSSDSNSDYGGGGGDSGGGGSSSDW